MPRQPQLATVPLTALVEELTRRFAEFEKAKKELLADGLQRVVYKEGSGREHVLFNRKRGGTSAYARSVSALVQKIRHAKGRNEDVTKLQKNLDRLRAQHSKA